MLESLLLHRLRLFVFLLSFFLSRRQCAALQPAHRCALPLA